MNRRHFFRTVAVIAGASTVLPPAAAGTAPVEGPLTIALHTQLGEVSYKNYARQTVGRVGRTVKFPEMVEGWAIVTHCAVYSISGEHIATLPLTPNLSLHSGVTPVVQIEGREPDPADPWDNWTPPR